MPVRNVITYKARRLSRVQTFWILLRFYGYYNIKAKFRRYSIVLKMLVTGETRLYYVYNSGQIVEVSWKNYLKVVKVDAKEYALLKHTSSTGEVWTKAERF